MLEDSLFGTSSDFFDSNRDSAPILAPNTSPSPIPAKRRRVTVEEVEDEDTTTTPWVYEEYPGEVAKSNGEGTTYFDAWRAEQTAKERSPHFPFADEEEWGLADWLMESTTQGGVDKFCKLPIVSAYLVR